MPRALSATRLKPLTRSVALRRPAFESDEVLIQGMARINKLDQMVVMSRFHLAEQILYMPAPAPVQPQAPESTYIVGFGRTHLPYCPNPNPQFQWLPA